VAAPDLNAPTGIRLGGGHGGPPVQAPRAHVLFCRIDLADTASTCNDGHVKSPEPALPDSELAARMAKLWPNREHEANSVLGLLCRVGVHRWRRLDLTELAPNKNIAHCFWCSKVKIDGVVYDI